MKCPFCDGNTTRVLDTGEDQHGNVRRRRECQACGRRFSTLERPLLALPVVIKRDGSREEFDRHKLMTGLRIACARRPISVEALEGIVDTIERTLIQSGNTEVPSKEIGDMVIEALRKIDEVAYIRYAIVYLGLKDLEAVRAEIDRLRAQTIP